MTAETREAAEIIGWALVGILVAIGIVAQAVKDLVRARRRAREHEKLREDWRRYRLEVLRAIARAKESGLAPPTRIGRVMPARVIPLARVAR